MRRKAEDSLTLEQTAEVFKTLGERKVRNTTIAEFCGVKTVAVSKWKNGHTPAPKKILELLEQ